jgi:hypothetical protein
LKESFFEKFFIGLNKNLPASSLNYFILAIIMKFEMKHFTALRFLPLVFIILFSAGCSVSSATVSQVETALGQTAAYQSAKLTVDKWAAKIGLTPQQTAQVLPMVQEYFTTVGTAVVNTNGSASQKATAAKNALVAKLKTVLTVGQVTKAVSQL